MKLNDEASKKLVEEIDKQQKLNIQYFYAPFEHFRVSKMLMSNEYIAVIGDFGNLRVKRHHNQINRTAEAKGDIFYLNDCAKPLLDSQEK